MMDVAQALALCGQPDSYERQEAIWLLSHLLDVNALELKLSTNRELTESERVAYLDGLMRLSQHEPIAYILGTQPFWTLDLKVTKDTLVPRPDTEVLIETVLGLSLDNEGISVLDLGTGTGAIALALASEYPKWSILATDIYLPTLNVAKENALRHQLSHVQFICSEWYAQIPKQQFDLIVSNPPYIAENDQHLLQLTAEPSRALVSVGNGLADIQTIITQAVDWLTQNGWLVIEHGYDQKHAVQDIFLSAGFSSIETIPDYAGNDRVTFAQLKK
ncbi:peptide chain release factor N(5)-glutamine methyltransferase [Acinetobacter apis]|uniref:Release factor glutamine methyltransferase n=2 Tax=Acinetobacter apis TaxID=1229165 RepID=A0A217EEB3_9GAMM|nr:[protein release factor]-glutamine N5-methyltransferase [Acinetobacter apis]